MASLTDLLRYKKELDIVHPVSKKPIKKVWLRVLGDYDLNKAYKAARIASSKKRLALRDPSTEDYQDEVMGVEDSLSLEEKLDLIKTSKLSTFASEAQAHVERPDIPKLEEVSPDPDAASLEDMETLDKKELEGEEEYRNKLQEYIDARTEELSGELAQKSLEEINEMAKFEVSNIVPFTIFLNEVNDHKLLYGVFKDKACSEREFADIDDVRNLPKEIKDLLLAELNELEIGTDEIKN